MTRERLDPALLELVPELASQAAAVITSGHLLNENGLFIVEHSNEEPPDISNIDLTYLRSCSYGLTVITFFKNIC